MNPPLDASLIAQAHGLYCRLTGQSLALRYDRERLWYEVLRAGHTLADVEHLIRYLQREIRAIHHAGISHHGPLYRLPARKP